MNCWRASDASLLSRYNFSFRSSLIRRVSRVMYT